MVHFVRVLNGKMAPVSKQKTVGGGGVGGLTLLSSGNLLVLRSHLLFVKGKTNISYNCKFQVVTGSMFLLCFPQAGAYPSSTVAR